MRTLAYPLKFQPIYKTKVWGGRRIARMGRILPGGPDNLVGESWELSDLVASAATGGGGGAERSIVANGPMAGKTLNQAMNAMGVDLMGALAPEPDGGFPLLCKYLDARETLSLQVHPSAAYSMAHPDAHLKSEAWYILEADPGSVIYKGLKTGVTPGDLRAALASGEQGRVVALLNAVPAKQGACHYLPSGTAHALGAGVLVAEIQTPSDTTFRLYDWGRAGRELSVEAAMQCATWGPPHVEPYEKRTHVAGMFTTLSRVCSCEHFRIEKVRMAQGYEQEIPYNQPTVWMVIQGRGEILAGDDSPAPSTPFQRGETLLVPARSEDSRVRLDEDTTWLEVTFPQAMPLQIA